MSNNHSCTKKVLMRMLTVFLLSAHFCNSSGNAFAASATTSAPSRVSFNRAQIKSIEDVTRSLIKDGAEIENVIIGRGVAATFLYAKKFKPKMHSKLDSIDEDTLRQSVASQMPKVVAIGYHSGSWNNTDYSLAQPYNLLEDRSLPFNASDFAPEHEYRENNYVNAKHLYYATQANQIHMGMPLLNAVVVNIDRLDSRYQLTVRLPEGNIIRVLAGKIDICTGLGSERNIFPEAYGHQYMTQSDYEAATKTDPRIGSKKLVGGYEYMLSDRPFENIPEDLRKSIVVYGGGGNATAVVRKSFFNQDDGSRSIEELDTPQDALNDVLWFSRSGVGDAGYGTKAMQAVEFTKRHGTLFVGELKKLLNMKKGLVAIFVVYKPLSDQEIADSVTDLSLLPYGDSPEVTAKLSSSAEVLARWKIDNIVMPVRASKVHIYCDQFVYSIGAEKTGTSEIPGVSALVSGLGDLTMIETPREVPLAYQDSTGNVIVHGAAATSYSWDFFSALRTKELKDQATLDGEWPGVMPPTYAAMKYLYERDELETVNVCTDFKETVELFLQKSGLKPSRIRAFKKRMLEMRRLYSAWGVSREQLQSFLDSDGFSSMFEIVPDTHTSIRIRQEL